MKERKRGKWRRNWNELIPVIIDLEGLEPAIYVTSQCLGSTLSPPLSRSTTLLHQFWISFQTLLRHQNSAVRRGAGADLRRSLILIHFSNYHSTSFETFYCYYFRKLHNFHCLSFYPSLSLSITPRCYFGRRYKSF